MADFIDIQTAFMHSPEVNGQLQNSIKPMVFRARLKSRTSAGKNSDIKTGSPGGENENDNTTG